MPMDRNKHEYQLSSAVRRRANPISDEGGGNDLPERVWR